MRFPLTVHRFFRGEFTPWIGWGLGIAVVAQVLVMLLLNPSITVPSALRTPEPFLRATVLGAEGEEQMVLLESESLFLPTPLNFGFKRASSATVARRTDFDVPPPVLAVQPGSGLGMEKGVAEGVPASWTALELAHWNPARSLGHRDQPQKALSARQALLLVERLEDGTVAWTEPVELGFGLTEAGALWRPVNFLCQIDAHGVEGVPVLVMAPGQSGVPGTGFPAIDALIKTFVENYPWAGRLPPGDYRITLTP